MAIYSCNLASIGRTTHAAGTAGAHLRYIARDGANPTVRSHIIPSDAAQARSWMDREEAAARKNARVADKIRIAIPRELTPEQRLQLVQNFVTTLTENRIPWMFAIHQDGKDAHNPHAHILVHDRDLKTGKRVLRLSDSARDRAKAGLEPKAVEWIRARWEDCANEALERAGHDTRIDRRSLETQGIERIPTIHIGPRGEQVDTHVQRPQSQARTTGTGREIDYPTIDQGRTRKERHAEIIDLNLERDARSPDYETRAWAQFEKIQIGKDRALEGELAEGTRQRTLEQRSLRKEFRAKLDDIRAERDHLTSVQQTLLRITFDGKRTTLREQQARERDTLHQKQRRLSSRIMRRLDLTGRTRKHQEADRRIQILRHREERAELAAERKAAWDRQKANLDQRFAPRLEVLAAQKAKAQSVQREMHQRGENRAEALRQLREAEREQARRTLADQLAQERQNANRKTGVSKSASAAFAAKQGTWREERKRGRGGVHRARNDRPGLIR